MSIRYFTSSVRTSYLIILYVTTSDTGVPVSISKSNATEDSRCQFVEIVQGVLSDIPSLGYISAYEGSTGYFQSADQEMGTLPRRAITMAHLTNEKMNAMRYQRPGPTVSNARKMRNGSSRADFGYLMLPKGHEVQSGPTARCDAHQTEAI